MGNWIITSSVLIIIVLLIRQLFKNKMSARMRYGLWLLVLIRLLVPVNMQSSNASILNLAAIFTEAADVYVNNNFTSPQNQQAFLQNQDSSQDSNIQNNIGTQNINSNLQDEAQDKGLPSIQKTALHPAVLFIRNLWIMGMVICTFIITFANLRFALKLKASRKHFPVITTEKLPAYIVDTIDSPCMFGLYHPAIYLRLEDTKENDMMQDIVLHENMHYKHKDHIWALGRSLCLILHWYNPFVWLAAYYSKQDAEFACDESVIRKLSDEKREAYGNTIISLSVKKNDYKNIIHCATSISGGKKHLKERIMRIAKRPKLLWIPCTIILFMCLAAILLTFTGPANKDYDDYHGLGLLSDIDNIRQPITSAAEEALLSAKNADIIKQINEGHRYDEDERIEGSLSQFPTWGMDVTYFYPIPPKDQSLETDVPLYLLDSTIPPFYWEKLPESAKTLPFYIVGFVCNRVSELQENYMTASEPSGNTWISSEDDFNPWVDWRIADFEWRGTYHLDDNIVDVYSYNYYFKLDETVDPDTILNFWVGAMTDMGDGWYQFDYGNGVAYDRGREVCFLAGGNDCYPGDVVYTSDLVQSYKRLFLDETDE